MNIVLLDNNFIIRELLRRTLFRLEKKIRRNLKVYTSANGVEGLGYVYVTNPDLVIVDSTLPKYSGRELVSYLSENMKYGENGGTIVVLIEEDKGLERRLPGNFYILNKTADDFLHKFENIVCQEGRFDCTDLSEGSVVGRVGVFFERQVLKIANKRDRLISKLARTSLLRKGLIYFLWIVNELFLSLMLFNLRLFSKRVNDDNIQISQSDMYRFRVRYYPTLAGIICSILILFLQVMLFVSGGMVIMNTRVESIFAIGTKTEKILFVESEIENFEYSENLVKFSEKGAELNPQKMEDFEEDVLYYPIGFENSASVTARVPSLFDISSISELSQKPDGTQIYYQVSPNNYDWYYFEKESGWEITSKGAISANTIQQLSDNFGTFSEEVSLDELFIRMFLYTENIKATPVLSQVIFKGEVHLLDTTSEPVETSPIISEYEPVQTELPEALVLNAAYANGQKIVMGRLEYLDSDNLLTIPEEEIDLYKVRIYYTSESDISRRVDKVDDLIKEVGIEVININGFKQYVYEAYSSTAGPGGYVTAQLVKYDQNGSVFSEGRFSRPLENDTFSVNETGDASDVSAGDGVCDRDASTPGSQCTLRAAIEEANALAGSDNITFNIPKTDGGYVDDDAGAGDDPANGDDYWVIEPTSSILPDITEAVVLDASTQTIAQGDTNTYGPEIEIDGVNFPGTEIVHTYGLRVLNTSDVSIRGLAIHSFKRQLSVYGTDNVQITENVLGLDAGGGVGTGTQQIGVLVEQDSDEVVIGNDQADGNVIGGFAIDDVGRGIRIETTASTGIIKDVYIRGNYIGIDKSGAPKACFEGIQLDGGETNLVVGGLLPEHMNYISNATESGIVITQNDVGYNYANTITIQNNNLGAGLDGLTSTPNYKSVNTQSSTSVDVSTVSINVGGCDTCGNIIEGDAHSIAINSNWVGEASYNTIIDARAVIRGYYGNTVTDFDFFNNWMGQTNSDPYFGLQIPPADEYHFLHLRGASSEVKGNYIVNQNVGIAVERYYLFYSNVYGDKGVQARPTIGGTAAYTGSLCTKNGSDYIEANCIIGQEYAISAFESELQNEDTIYIDNYFGTSEQQTNLIHAFQKSWAAGIEIFSNNVRRHDLSGQGVVLPRGDDKYYGYDTKRWEESFLGEGSTMEGFAEFDLDCDTPADCSIDNPGELNGKSAILTDVEETVLWYDINWPLTWLWINEFVIYPDGEVEDLAGASNPYQLDALHIASSEFSFDGNSTTHPVMNDRAQSWTQDPVASGDFVTDELGIYQIMEAEVVDANPMLQEDGSYLVVVDSLTSEDNVSLAGFDDGGGSYSGGGSEGVDGLSNLATSLSEAVFVASNFDSENLKIVFDDSLGDTLNLTSPIQVSGDSNSIRDIIDGRGIVIDGSGLGVGEPCIDATDLNNFTITNFEFRNCPEAIRLNSGSGNTITQNIFDGSYISLLNDSNDSIQSPTINAIEYLSGGRYRISGTVEEDDLGSIEVCLSSDSQADCLQSLVVNDITTPAWQVLVSIPNDDGTQNRSFSALATNSSGSSSEFSNFVDEYSLLDYPVSLTYPVSGQKITDITPILDWNDNADLDLDYWQLYLAVEGEDLALLVEVEGSTTSYQVLPNQALEAGKTYQWQVVGIRENESISGSSEIAEFEVIELNTFEFDEIELVYPVNIEIDEQLPTFKWRWVDNYEESSECKYYLSLYAETLVTEETRLVGECTQEVDYTYPVPLSEGRYTWKVSVFENDEEILQSAEAGFSVKLEVEEALVQNEEISAEAEIHQNENKDNGLKFLGQEIGIAEPVLLVGGFVGLIGVAVSGTLAAGVAGATSGQVFGVLLGSILYRRKKSWGIVIDANSSKPIAFALLRLRDEEGKLVKQTVTDLDGEYGFRVEDSSQKYHIEVKASGYQTVQKTVRLGENEIASDFELIPNSEANPKKSIRLRPDKIIKYTNVLVVVSLVIGFSYTVYSFITSPNNINTLFLFVYGILMFFNAFVLYRVNFSKDKEVGSIYDESGMPLEGVSIRFYRGGELMTLGLSGAHGVIRVKLNPGQYWVVVSKEGFAPTSYEVKIDSKGYMNKNLTLGITKSSEDL